LAELAITCTSKTLKDRVDIASGARAIRRIVEFDVGPLKLAVTVEIAVAGSQQRQCTRIHLGNLYAMEWRGHRRHVTPRWAALSWAARLATEMHVGETRQFDVGPFAG